MNSINIEDIKLDAILMLACYAGTSDQVISMLDISREDFRRRAVAFDAHQDTNRAIMVYNLFLSYARHSTIKNWKVKPRGL